MKPITENGDLAILFSENLEIPQKVQDLLDQREVRRQLPEVADNTSSSNANETLDAYVKEVFEMKAMQYSNSTGTYRGTKIAFNPHLVTWNNQGMKINFNFSYPLQVSRDLKKD